MTYPPLPSIKFIDYKVIIYEIGLNESDIVGLKFS